MKFIEHITKEQFDDFVDRHPYGSFLQTYDWGKFKSLGEWKMDTVGMEEEGTLICATLLLSRKLPGISKTICYAPRGLLVDYRNTKILDSFLAELKQFVKKKKGIFLRIDPIIKTKSYDLEGNEIQGENNEDVISILTQRGFHYKGNSKGFEGFQPRYVMKLNISRDLEKVFESFHKKTQYNIRLAQRRGIRVRRGTKEDLPEFHRIMKITGERDGFTTRNLAYFQEMFDALQPNDRLEFFVAQYEPKQLLPLLENNRKDLEEEIKRLEIKREKIEEGTLKEKTEKQIAQKRETLQELSGQIESTKEDRDRYPQGLMVSGTLALRTDTTVCYLYGASDNAYRNYMANYLIQWEMIQWAKERGASCYDFRGISGNLSEEDPLYGLYKFKKGFSPEFIEYLGEFDLVVHSLFYFLFEKALPLFKKIRKKIRS